MSGNQQDITTLPAIVTMPIARWNQVLDILGTQPWREVNPLIVDLHRQLQDAVNAQRQPQQQANIPMGARE